MCKIVLNKLKTVGEKENIMKSTFKSMYLILESTH